MFDHVSIGVSDIGRAKKFYDAALKPLGYERLSDGETSLGYGDKGKRAVHELIERGTAAGLLPGPPTVEFLAE